jgi:hypothetical protein
MVTTPEFWLGFGIGMGFAGFGVMVAHPTIREIRLTIMELRKLREVKE